MIINDCGVINQAISKWGKDYQSVIAIEEMSELTKELSKAIRGNNNHAAIVEETADVMIVLMEIRAMYKIKDMELQKVINAKLDRLRKRIDDDPDQKD